MGEKDIVWVIEVDKDHIFGDKSLLYIGDLDREKSYIWERGDKCCQRPYIWWKKTTFYWWVMIRELIWARLRLRVGYIDNLHWKGSYNG